MSCNRSIARYAFPMLPGLIFFFWEGVLQRKPTLRDKREIIASPSHPYICNYFEKYPHPGHHKVSERSS
jgi:hypothetical protein